VAAPNFGFATKRAAGPEPGHPTKNCRSLDRPSRHTQRRLSWAAARPGPAPESAPAEAGNPPVSTSRSVAGPVWRLTTVSAAIWSPNLGVFAVSAAGVLCAFPAWWTRYLDSVSACLAQVPLSLLFLELSGYYVNIVQLHVNAADVLVRRGIDRDGSR
jgi:hypothetical protein